MRHKYILLAWMAWSGGCPLAAAEVVLGHHRFTLPEGMEIDLVAGPPLVDRPISADFDAQGRLYVSDSSGSNDPVEKQLAERPHRIVRLEDTNGDGRYDRRTVFADRMMFPEGVLWHDGALLVAAPPSIWKLTDLDGDGVADRREQWFQGRTLTGCANDLHGPYLGPDGWIYWCKGAFAEQTHARPGRPPLVTRAAHIFRCRPDGTGLEPVMTGGMDNPVEVAFTPTGERIFTTTFLQHPAQGQRDGLIHAIYGGVYGKDHDVLQGHPRTGELMPVLVHLGAAAPSGLARLESGGLGEPFRGNLVATLFNMQKVTRHVLEPSGATFTTRDEDLLVSAHRDFHPTDVLEDADGSLLVIDTGGWYKLCCPTSQLAKPDVLGGIYRLRRRDAAAVADPRGAALNWSALPIEALAGLLGDARWAVRRRAADALARRGAAAAAVVAAVAGSSAAVEHRRQAVWVLARIDAAEARRAVRARLRDAAADVAHSALAAVSLWRDREAVGELLQVLASGGPTARRLASEALGRIGDAQAVAPLVAAAASTEDRALEHAVIYALWEINDHAALRAALAGAAPQSERAAMVALDQVDGGGADPRRMAQWSVGPDPLHRATARWLIGRNPSWGAELADFYRGRIAAGELSDAELAEWSSQLARLAGNLDVQQVLAQVAAESNAPTARLLAALAAMERSGLADCPQAWAVPLAEHVRSPRGDVAAAALAAARLWAGSKQPAPQLALALRELAHDERQPVERRLQALAAVPGGPAALAENEFRLARDALDPRGPVGLRSLGVEVLLRAELSGAQRRALCQSLRSAGPLELPRLLAVFERGSEPQLGLELVAALNEATAVGSLRSETVRPLVARFGSQVEAAASELLARLDAQQAQQKSRLQELAGKLAGGDVRRGQTVFNSEKAACAACHAIGYLGGTVGPDLTRIGQIRSELDLLEAIAFPSASFVRSYEPVHVETVDGRIFQGVVRRDAADELVLATGPREEVRLARSDIESLRPGSVSVMPAGLDQQLTPEELADLVAFLKAAR